MDRTKPSKFLAMVGRFALKNFYHQFGCKFVLPIGLSMGKAALCAPNQVPWEDRSGVEAGQRRPPLLQMGAAGLMLGGVGLERALECWVPAAYRASKLLHIAYSYYLGCDSGKNSASQGPLLCGSRLAERHFGRSEKQHPNRHWACWFPKSLLFGKAWG